MPAIPSFPKPDKSKKSKKTKKSDDSPTYDDWRRYRDRHGFGGGIYGDGFSWGKATNKKCAKGTIGSGEGRKAAIWMAEKESDGKLHLYMTCVHEKCAAVNDFSKHKVDADGRVHPCIVCVKCADHEFIELEGWTLGERVEEKTQDDLEWEKRMAKWKDWKPSDDKGGYKPSDWMGGEYFL